MTIYTRARTQAHAHAHAHAHLLTSVLPCTSHFKHGRDEGVRDACNRLVTQFWLKERSIERVTDLLARHPLFCTNIALYGKPLLILHSAMNLFSGYKSFKSVRNRPTDEKHGLTVLLCLQGVSRS